MQVRFLSDEACSGPEAKHGWEMREYKNLRSVSGMELVMEELVEVIVLMDGLIPYAGKVPVIAAVWDTQAAGSMGRIGSPEREHAPCEKAVSSNGHPLRWTPIRPLGSPVLPPGSAGTHPDRSMETLAQPRFAGEQLGGEKRGVISKRDTERERDPPGAHGLAGKGREDRGRGDPCREGRCLCWDGKEQSNRKSQKIAGER